MSSRKKRDSSCFMKISPWRQACIHEGYEGYIDMRWHYHHDRGDNKWSRIHKDGKIRRIKPPWKSMTINVVIE